MEIEVIKAFVDNANQRRHKEGDVISVSDVRGKYIIKKGYAVQHKEQKPKNNTKEEKQPYKTK